MLDRVAGSPVEQVFETARKAHPAQALQATCLLATGRDGFLAGACHAVHRSGAPLVAALDAAPQKYFGAQKASRVSSRWGQESV